MPVIGIPIDMLEARLGMELGRDELVEHLLHLGCDVEGFATLRRFKCGRCGQIMEITETQNPPVECTGCGCDYRENEEALAALGESDVIRMELLAVRPDIFDPGGLARALRAYLGEETGLREYALEEPKLEVKVDPITQGPKCPRPAIACAVIRDVKLDDDLIKAIMKLQENLHWALGRDRKHASIGVYDLDTVQGNLHYRGVGPTEVRFVPLGFSEDDPDAAMTPAEVLEKHPKGVGFARLLEGFERYPLLQDEKGGVLSLPPIINSEATRVRDETSAFFIDVTGTTFDLVNKTLSILVTSLKELQKDLVVEKVDVRYPDRQVTTPDMTPEEVVLHAHETAKLIGVALDKGQVGELLEKMAHGVLLGEEDTPELTVQVPSYRTDILHPRDLMEDVAIAYGYHNIQPTLVPSMTIGQAHPVEELADLTRNSLVGLGFWEVMTLALTSAERSFEDMRLEEDPNSVFLAHPISKDQTQLRVSLLPGLLETLAANTHRELPQKLFEVGPVTFLDPEAETGAAERLFLASVWIDAHAGAAEARASCEAVLRELGVEAQIRNGERGCYLEGRCGEIVVDGRVCGYLGEIHPFVLNRFNIGHPVAAFELDLQLLG